MGGMTTLRDLLNRARWGGGDLQDLEIVVVHRGAPGDRRALSGSRIVTVGPAGIELMPEASEEEGAFIPYHRFLAIRGPDGSLLWDRERGLTSPAAKDPPPRDPAEPSHEVLPSFSVVLEANTAEGELVLDGSAGEGGGQILRTALTLSMLTGRPFVLERIRGGRERPGLLRQHLTSVKAAAAIADADVDGADLGSARLTFRPRAVRGGSHTLDIGSAGSVSLVLQTLALPLALSSEPSRVRVRGGTHALWAPIYPFLELSWLPRIRQAGADLSLALHRPGFYPAGGGEAELTTTPSGPLRPLHLPEPSGELDVSIQAIVSDLPEHVAQRELAAVSACLQDAPLDLRWTRVQGIGPGNAVWLVARDRSAGTSNVFSAIGQPGVRAEDVGREAANAFLAFRDAGASVEPYLADQLMLPIALAGEGSFTTSDLSLHARTNIEVIHAFTGRRLRAFTCGDRRYRITLSEAKNES